MELPALRPLGSLRFLFQTGEPVRDQQHRNALVGVLAALGLHLDRDAGGNMGGADRGLRLVDVLPAGPRRAGGLEADFARQAGRGRVTAQCTDEPVLALMRRPVRTCADPLDGSFPGRRQGLRAVAVQADQDGAQCAGAGAALLFEDIGADLRGLRLAQQEGLRLGDGKAAFVGSVRGG
ncbi:hypothetical protein D3C72_1685930 [compost metagenome]